VWKTHTFAIPFGTDGKSSSGTGNSHLQNCSGTGGPYCGMTKRSSPKLTIETISPYFTQNIQTASKELGICCTLLKKICRKYGITRWPYRKIQSVDRTIQQIKERMSYLETQLPRDSSGSVHLELQKLHREYLELERKRQALLRPDKALSKSTAFFLQVLTCISFGQLILTIYSPTIGFLSIGEQMA
jgi:hypothetical protein